MGAFSNYFESGILNATLRANTNTFAFPTTVALALCANAPTETQSGGTIPEITNAGSYARLAITKNNSNWTEVVQVSTSGWIENGAEFLFTTATADWGHVSGWALVTSATYGAGDVIMLGTFPTPRVILSGDAAVIRAGSIDIYLD